MEENIKYLGVDWGEKRIGLALADSETGLALPFKVVDSLFAVLEVINSEGIDEIVLGEPKKMSGAEANPDFLAFRKKLEAEAGVKVNLADERLSSLAADALVGEKEDKAERDAVAAMLILQNYLDGLLLT
ncbi:MAG TPA: Holliday junction resolvase RuvX [bacterium]|nr:Holliday junction resolvase RuvX [bacterium]HPT29917.1 Holliday junction resolvase RuvX [bacterium]